MTQDVVLLGAGGLAREVLDCVRAGTSHRVIALLDDDLKKSGTRVSGVPVVGCLDRVTEFGAAYFLACAGRGVDRQRMVDRLTHHGITDSRHATVVHPSASIGASSGVGPGSILLAGVVLTANVVAGRCVVAMPGAVLTHDVVLHDFATVCAGVALGGSVVVGERAYLGMSSCVRQGVHVGPDALLGMGSILLENLPAGETWVGVPARPIAGHEPLRCGPSSPQGLG